MASIVKKEFAAPHNERGWIYDELIEMGDVSGDPWYHQAARDLAEFYADKFYRPGVGVVYKTSSGIRAATTGSIWRWRRAAPDPGRYRLPRTGLEIQGAEIVKFVRGHAYVPKYQLFLHQMDEVVLPMVR